MLFSFTVGVPICPFRKALGADAEFAFGMSVWPPNASLKNDWFGDAAQFAILFKEKFGYEPDYHAASGVADVETFVKAIEAANSLDPKQTPSCTVLQISIFRQIVVQIQGGEVVPNYTTASPASRSIPSPVGPRAKWRMMLLHE